MKTLKPEEVKTIIKNAPQGSNPNTVIQALINKGYILEGLNDKPVEKPDGFLKSIGKDVVETLVVKPADRVAEAVGRTGILGEDIKKGYEAMADEGESRQFNVPGLGEIDVEAQKGGSEGARQIGGEALKIGSFLFPYGKVAGAVGSKVLGASKLTPIALKTAKTVGNIASGATGGYLADVGYNLSDDSKTLGEAFTPGLGTLIGGSIPVAGTVFKAGKRAVQGSRNVKDVTKRVIQGETKDIPLAEQAFKNIDLKGVKSRQELSQRLSSAMENQMKVVDDYLSKDPRALSLDEYAIRTTNNVGQEVKTDVISNALTHLEDFYKQAGDDLSASNVNLIKQKAVSEGLTHQEVNNIARMYSEEFGTKAFNKVGDPLTSVNAQMFENTRTGLKQAARGGLGYGAEAQAADKLYSAMNNTKRLIDKGVEGVNKLEARLKNRNIIQKLSYGAVKVINALTGGALKAGVEALGVSNIGNKIDNWINLERSLQKDLEFIQKANNIRTDSALIKFIEDFSKRFKFPGDAMVDDLSTRGKQLKNIPNKQGGFVSLGQSESALPIKRTTNTIKKNIPKTSNISPKSTTKSLKGKGTIPENSLISEVKKYKSAEEFVKAQGESIYRGGKPTDLTKGKDRGISFAKTNEVAQRFAKNDSFGSPRTGGVVDEFVLPKSAKILDAKTVTPSILKNDFIGYSKEDAIVKYARREGYDAVDFTKSLVSDPKLKGTWMPEDEIRIINPDILKTKSQLTDIWKKANKK